MASIANSAGLRAAAVALLCCCAVAAQDSMTTREASARRDGDLSAVHEGERAVVRGVVSCRVIRVTSQVEQLGIEQDGYGLVLEAEGNSPLRGLQPGNRVEAAGRIAARSGLIVMQVASVKVLGHGPAPAPVALEVDELQGFRHLGRLVVTEGRLASVRQNIAGSSMLIGLSDTPYKLFVPGPQYADAIASSFSEGDTIRVVGMASQYCAAPPYNRGFQLNVADPSHVMRTGHPLVLPPSLVAGFLVSTLLFAVVWYTRERRLKAQREALRRSHELGEEILGASSAQDILHKLVAVVPAIFGVTRVRLYLLNPGTKTLDKVPQAEDEAPLSILPGSPRGGTDAGAAACFQNRMALAVPDSSRCPFPPPDALAPPMPRAVLFVPMFAQGEAVGVFEIGNQDRVRDFSPDEQAVAQHLSNQIGVALKLLDQRSVREQLFRTEKLAAVGRLISGVVNELQAPLSSICNLADMALQQQPAGSGQLRVIAVEARKANDMVSRLVSFASSEPVEARPVDVNLVLRKMAEFREREWKARGIRVRALVADEPLPVLGSEGQLEQVILHLIVDAEQALQDSPEKLITLRTMRLARRALVEIAYSGRRGEEPSGDAAAALGLGVCRSIIAGHGGELRAIYLPDTDPRFEIELPRAVRERSSAPAPNHETRDPSQSATALVIEPDEAVERHLLALLTSRGYRVVPVPSSDSGLDLAQRLRFDVVFCSVRAPGLNWVELSEGLQSRVGGFVLLSDGYDPELAADFEGDGRYVLAKPIDENILERALQKVEAILKARAAAR
ncbi:MAG TPA: GAF domain-containing protein [Bryobacteraceae bacterium]|nr:GAF domain-containing protein [Bryobacteraceae bacterium]